MTFGQVVEDVGKALDGVGVAAIVVGVVFSTVRFLLAGQQGDGLERYRSYRQRTGRAILLGLELLVAADIIRTVAVSPSFRTVGILAVIVLIRTFLSFSIELELSGRWPWQRAKASDTAQDATITQSAQPSPRKSAA